MKRLLLLLPVLLLFAAPAAQAAPSCTRDGAKLLAASGSVRVVSMKDQRGKTETRHDRVLGCRSSTGRRFTMFESVDHGEDSIQHDTLTIYGNRYVGVDTTIEGGASLDRRAATYDTNARKRLHTTQPCDAFDRGDVGGIVDVVFFKNGAMAYACDQLRIADGKGDRQLEPQGTTVGRLAVSGTNMDFGPRLYWTANGTVKSLDV
jgi:hypothetical protein